MANYMFFLCGYHVMNLHFCVVVKIVVTLHRKGLQGYSLGWGVVHRDRPEYFNNARFRQAQAYILLLKAFIDACFGTSKSSKFQLPKTRLAMNACDVY